MNPLVGKLSSNPHTTSAGAAFIVLKAGTQIALMWFPNQADKIKATAEILEGVAGFYGLAMAGDAGQGQKAIDDVKQDVAKVAAATGNTDLIARKDLPTTDSNPKVGV